MSFIVCVPPTLFPQTVKIFGSERTEKDEPWSAHTTNYNFLDRVTETHNRGVIAVGGSLDDAIRAHGLDTRAFRWLEHDGQTTRVRRERRGGPAGKKCGNKTRSRDKWTDNGCEDVQRSGGRGILQYWPEYW